MKDAERERDPGGNEDGAVRDRQAAQLRERLEDADETVRELPDHGPDNAGE